MPGPRTALLTAGICSVTLRQLPIQSVVASASQAGLDGIEWGTDTHLKHDAEARTASRLCRSRGLRVLSLGSYYRLGDFTGFDVVLSRAQAAGAPRIRVWAGGKGSAEASRGDWSAVVGDAQRISDLAAAAGIQIALEYHGRTLTDSTLSTLRLLDRIDRAERPHVLAAAGRHGRSGRPCLIPGAGTFRCRRALLQLASGHRAPASG
ncbi:sugar phosphate isomerase/epimerase family protein [Arthrobacter sp. 2MCAF14]|uniref:sugar phosphate isomerase/epimerase family protein n=1 Tax=Arthrobacter sp. 2MCAF14 TaxID=3232982 RepID=UPI003F924AC0